MPGMLSTIVDDLLSRESDIVVVGRSVDREDALLRAREERADVVITEDSNQGSTCLNAILSGPPLSIFALAPDGLGAVAIDLTRRKVRLDGDKETLADAIRQLTVSQP
jgi:DNA-binding NarL/FixJ family response regulator